LQAEPLHLLCRRAQPIQMMVNHHSLVDFARARRIRARFGRRRLLESRPTPVTIL
jgi:hypothetical protein